MRLRTEKFVRKIIKVAIFFALVFLYIHPEYVKKPLYQRLYANPYPQQINVWEQDVFADLSSEQAKPFSREYDGIKVTFLPQKAYAATARIGYVDRYEGLWEKFFHGHDINRKIYNSFAPLDLALVYGANAYHEKFFSCFKHEYRLLWSCPEIDTKYLNNYHIIPANDNLRKGVATLKQGDVIYIAGLLVNVRVPNWNEMLTGTSHNMTHKDQFAGGLYTGMCFILYLQKLIVDGYVYE